MTKRKTSFSMKKFFKSCSLCLGFAAIASLCTATILGNALPASYQVVEGQVLSFGNSLPISARQDAESPSQDGYTTTLKLFGIIPVKEAQVQVVSKTYVQPVGEPFGIKIFTDGVMVVGMTDVDSSNGLVNPAKKAGIAIGDVIHTLNGAKVVSNEHLAALLEKCNGKTVTLETSRGNDKRIVQLTPVRSKSDGLYKAGMWVRDSSAGIGTMTFYVPSTGMYGGLGHPICDADTGEILPLSKGSIVGAKIQSVIPSENGRTGELCGQFDESQQLGSLSLNTISGVYGSTKQPDSQFGLVPIALPQEVKAGPAQVITTIDNEGPKAYDCMIEKVDLRDDDGIQNLVVRITDTQLLQKTGGIVQGMSGSPILQNGKLAGAVTHVFVNDPQRGYGIFAHTMYETAANAAKG